MARKNTDGGIQIGGNLSITNGDFVGGDKNMRVARGGVLVEGDVQNSNIVTGHHNRVGNRQSGWDDRFAEILDLIQQRSGTSLEDKEDLKANVSEIKAEAEKGERADQSFLARRLRNIQRIAPDIAEVVLATLANPLAGLAAIVKGFARHVQKTAEAQEKK